MDQDHRTEEIFNLNFHIPCQASVQLEAWLGYEA